MWTCGACKAQSRSSENFKHNESCFAKDDSRLFGSGSGPPNKDAGGSLSHEERRTRAMERQAEALQHLATAHVDGMRAFEALVKMALPIAEHIAKGIAEEAETRKAGGRKPFA